MDGERELTLSFSTSLFPDSSSSLKVGIVTIVCKHLLDSESLFAHANSHIRSNNWNLKRILALLLRSLRPLNDDTC